MWHHLSSDLGQGDDGIVEANALDLEGASDSFRSLDLQGTYSPKDKPFENFYSPLLKIAVSYERAVGYWSAAELQFAAQGTAHFLANGGRMRLIVGAQLNQNDVNAILSGIPLDEVVASRLLSDPDLEGARIIQDHHLSVLSWMVRTDRLEIRVGVPRDESGNLLSYQESGRYFHTKYGILSDRYGNQIAFNGSNNSSVAAWTLNHETFDVYPSWKTEIWDYLGVHKVKDFENHWQDNPDIGWAVIDLPTAVKRHLVQHAPEAPPLPIGSGSSTVQRSKSSQELDTQALELAWKELLDLRDAPKESPWTGVGSAWVTPLPHQSLLVQRVVSSYPRGYLLADEVGLGKTIEAGLVLRELFTSGKAQRALLLAPSSVLKQWQEELHEKMNIDVARYHQGGFLDRFDRPIEPLVESNPWSAFPIVLASSHLARRRDRRREIIDAGPWDIVLVDEAHHARRRGSNATDTPNSLLQLLLEMRNEGKWRALYLATATPMQMYPHEAWDLISLLGLPGKWGERAFYFTQYFTRLNDAPQTRGWKLLSDMLSDYFSDSQAERDHALEAKIEEELGYARALEVFGLEWDEPSPDQKARFPNAISSWMDLWLRRHTPMRDRVFRNTRKIMRKYQEEGVISESVTIPHRQVSDEFIPLSPKERRLYERIEEYIRRHYNAYMASQGKQALGFIMTIYRRRLTSSFWAIKRSLERRLDVLERGRTLEELLTEDDRDDVENTLFDLETLDLRADRLRDEILELKSFLAELATISGEDTKASKLIADINEAFEKYSSIVVFTQYTDTMDYVRERLIVAGYYKLGCYSGRGAEVYDSENRAWESVTKAEIKEDFRNGQVTILLGTDSMSEGLNLQTAGRLINYDMPWNLMRVEQRIGRVDRIGAAYHTIFVSNYFYDGTVEEQVYKGIAEDYGDFTNIVGDASPVLSSVEQAIGELALSEDISATDVTAKVLSIQGQMEEVKTQPVQTSDFGHDPDAMQLEEMPVLAGAVELADLERILTRNVLTRRFFEPDPRRQGVYWLTLPVNSSRQVSFCNHSGITDPNQYLVETTDIPIAVTFDRQRWDESDDVDLIFLTYGTPELAALLPADMP